MQINAPEKSDRPLIIIASNRGPFKFIPRNSGGFDVERGTGGLVTALSALAQKHDVLWVASAIGKGDYQWAKAQGDQPTTIEDITLSLITPDKKRYNQYYNDIANPLLWFIQHQLWNIPRTPSITAETWQAWEEGYKVINRQFAETIADTIKDVDRPVFVFPQDYHLYLLPDYLRQMVDKPVQIQPFLHIPWPGPDAWRILPEAMREEILNGLLQSDRIGFQTTKDAFNFVQTCRFYLSNAHSKGRRNKIDYLDRTIDAKTYPISIDIQKVQELVKEPQTQLLKSQLLSLLGDRKLILRVDRVEPSKNILRGLEAFEIFLEDHSEYRGRVMMVALLVPSRMEVDEYQDYLREIMAQAGMINARYSDPFWEPVRVIVGDNYHRALAAMQLYDVLLVNPLADGMNLVAKEGVLVNQKDGPLILSEHAGVFYEFHQHALNVSPFDVYGTANAIYNALEMAPAERRKRAEGLLAQVKEVDVRDWFATQVQDALTSFTNQANSASTPVTPSARQSAASATSDGMSSEKTPTPTASSG